MDLEMIWCQFKENGSDELRNLLVEHYIHLVKYNAERIHSKLPNEAELDDLIIAGVFGLMNAINAFDFSRGVKFETYCAPRIRGAILDEIRKMTAIPRNAYRRFKKLKEAVCVLESQLGHKASVDEISEHTGISEGDIFKTQNAAFSVISLDQGCGTDGEETSGLVGVLECPQADKAFDEIESSKLKRAINWYIDHDMRSREKQVIQLYYYENMTFTEIASLFGVSRQWVCQMHSSILNRLRLRLKRRNII